jgi:putative transcriptional regulator
MGLVINRPTEVKLSELLPDIEALGERSDTVFIGGPVARGRMSLLVRAARKPEGCRRVFEDVYVGSSRRVLQRIVREGDAGTQVKVFAGYAGWAPGQLDREVARGDWYIWPADAKSIFEKKPSEVWPELITRSAVEWTRIPEPRGRPAGRAGRSFPSFLVGEARRAKGAPFFVLVAARVPLPASLRSY